MAGGWVNPIAWGLFADDILRWRLVLTQANELRVSADCRTGARQKVPGRRRSARSTYQL